MVVRVGGGFRVGWADRLRDRDRLAEAHDDPAVAASEPCDEAQEPAEALLLLGGAPLLGGVVAHVRDLVVDDRDRNEHDLFTAPATVGVDDIGEQAEARRKQLSRTRAAALDVPLEGEALLDQVVDVMAQDELVDGRVLERTPDEEDARAPHQRPEREEVHVDAAGRMVGRQAVLMQDRLQHAVIEVRLVGRQEHHRVLLGEPADVLDLLGIVVQHFPVRARIEDAPELHDEVDHEGRVGRRDLAQAFDRLGPYVLVLATEFAGQGGELAAEGRALEDALVDEARDLVAGAAHPSLRAVESERGLLRHEVGEADRVARVRRGVALPAFPELRRQRRLGGHDATPFRRTHADQSGTNRIRVPGVAELQEIGEARTPHAFAFLRQPGDAQGRQQRVVADGQGGFEARIQSASSAAGGRQAELLDDGSRFGRLPLDPVA